MGKELIELFPYARTIISELDVALQSLGAHAPAWSLLGERPRNELLVLRGPTDVFYH